jgi:S-DNA-T family DNA segregation ATPase FtsK/SpoIIIE
VSGNLLLSALEELIDERTAGVAGQKSQLHGPISVDDSVLAKGAKVGDDEAMAEDSSAITQPSIVVLISDDAPVDRARLVAIVERAALAGIHPVWVSETVEQLPAACRTFVDVHASAEPAESVSASVGYVRLGETFPVVSERVRRQDALDFAMSLAGVTDAGAYVADESDMPRSVSLVALLGPEMLDASDAVIDRWRQNDSVHDRTPDAAPRSRRPGKLRAIVGQSNLDSMHLDLRAQGPHALVGGTTGSGKSEFLQAWVLGMAAEYSPDRVTFLFVDYKGGSAFADCVKLPHCVGLVTDLNTHLVRRALTSLRAELHNREHLFNRKGVKDLLELEKRGDVDCPPALVIVIDEFAALVGEVPEFVDGVVDIAQRGRSLGIHLIMATQRPAGVIRDNLRANTNLRIALRMADAHDSLDVVGVPVAASFDPSVPGRGVVRSGPGRVESFQTGYAGGWTSADAAGPAIEVADLTFGSDKVWEDPAPAVEPDIHDLGPNDTARLVATITKASREAGVPAPRKPWLDELAATYDLALLHQRTDEQLVLGVTDDPTVQRQYPVYFRPDLDGNLAIYGTGGSGKSVALRTLAVAAGITPRGGPVHVYGIDFSAGGLRMLEPLPHVGSIIAGDDSERILRLIRMLRGLIDERSNLYATVRAGSIAEYRTLAKKPEEPRILLLVDGMATFRQEYEFTGASNVFPMFQQILSDGRQVGIHVVMSADRPASVSPTIAASVQRRIALRLADDGDYLLLDSPGDIISSSSPPGRALVDQLETQFAVLGGSSNVAAQSLAIERLAEAMTSKGVQQAPPIRRLPEHVALGELLSPVDGQAVIGIADDTLEAVSVRPEGVFLLAGPPSSGRSTALLTLLQSAHAAVPKMQLAYFGNSKSPVRGSSLWKAAAAGSDEVSALAKELLAEASKPATASHKIGIVIESVSDFLNTPADADLVALIKAAKRNDHLVIAEGETSTLMPSWPLLMELKSARRGFALQPDPQEGDTLFRTTYPRARRSEFPPGRGWLIEGGKARRVQLALPE